LILLRDSIPNQILRIGFEDFCFRAWQDGDALFLLTDKLDLDVLKRRLRLQELNSLIQEAAAHYDGQP
jgi:hypothetical protein